MTMILLPNDGGVREYVERLLRQEDQFDIQWHPSMRTALISFHKGDWTIQDKDTRDRIEISDNPDVRYSYSSFVEAFLKARVVAHEESGAAAEAASKTSIWGIQAYDARSTPAKVICDYLEIRYGRIENVMIDVLQSGRNGRIEENGKRILAS